MKKYQKYLPTHEEIAKKEMRELRRRIRRELSVLNFMKKNDVFYYHHNTSDSMKKLIVDSIDRIKKGNRILDSNSKPYCYLGCVFRSNEFDDIYDVPTDGTYIFYIYDSGQRGLGANDFITVKKADKNPHIPYVNPGSIIPIAIY